MPASGRLAAFAFLEEADVLALGNFQDGEGVVQFGHVDIGRLELCHLEGFLRRQGDSFQVGRIIALLQGVRVGGLAKPGDDNGRLGRVSLPFPPGTRPAPPLHR